MKSDQQEMVDLLFPVIDEMNQWEYDFLMDMVEKSDKVLSPGQSNALSNLYEKYKHLTEE